MGVERCGGSRKLFGLEWGLVTLGKRGVVAGWVEVLVVGWFGI